MANTNITHRMIALEAAKILEEKAPFLMNVNKARQSEFDKNVNGYNVGETVDIEIPHTGRVFTGAVFAEGGAATDVKMRKIALTLNNQKHIGIQFGSKERMLDIADFRSQVLNPLMATFSSTLEADAIAAAIQSVPNIVGTPGVVPAQMKVYAQARAKLENELAPAGDRCTLISSDANVEMVDSSRQLFHAGDQIKQGFLEGRLGRAQGSDFYEHQSMYVHTNGTQAAWTVTGAGQSGATLNISGLTAAQTIRKGTVFTIAGVFAVHPLTGLAYSTLRQFVVTADFTAAGATGAISIYPEINATAPNKTVSASPAAAAACTMFGNAATSYRQNLMFEKNAFTYAAAPLELVAGSEGYVARLKSGISVRVMTFGDGVNDRNSTRIDVLSGQVSVRSEHACRITE